MGQWWKTVSPQMDAIDTASKDALKAIKAAKSRIPKEHLPYVTEVEASILEVRKDAKTLRQRVDGG